MRHFYFDGDEGSKGKNMDNFDDEDMEIVKDQVNLVAVDLNQKMMQMAVSICEKSFWWYWASADQKIAMLTKVYGAIEMLTAGEVEIEFQAAIIDEDEEFDEDDLLDLDEDDEEDDED